MIASKHDRLLRAKTAPPAWHTAVDCVLTHKIIPPKFFIFHRQVAKIHTNKTAVPSMSVFVLIYAFQRPTMEPNLRLSIRLDWNRLYFQVMYPLKCSFHLILLCHFVRFWMTLFEANHTLGLVFKPHFRIPKAEVMQFSSEKYQKMCSIKLLFRFFLPGFCLFMVD